MATKSAAELLGLPAEAKRPNAYEILGLTPGESDETRIQKAVATQIARLKAARDHAPPKAWASAVKAVQSAQGTLADAKMKAELDRKLSPDTHVSAAPIDPLADLLPPSNPAGPSVTPAPSPLETQIPASEEPTLSNEPATASVSNPPTISNAPPAPQTQPAAQIRTGRTRRRKKKRSRSLSTIVLGLFVVALLSSVGGLLYLLGTGKLGSGQVAIATGPNGIVIQAGSPQMPISNPTVASRPAQQRHDGVMPINVPSSRAPDRVASLGQPDRSATEAITEDPRRFPDSSVGPNSTETGMDAIPPTPVPPMVNPTNNPSMEGDASNDVSIGNMAPGVAMNATGADGAPEPPMPEPSMPEPPVNGSEPTTAPSPEALQAGADAISQARLSIQNADWAMMKSLSETAENKAANDQQRSEAGTLYQVADLASYYHGGIIRAIGSLQAGNEFNLTETMTVIVTEANEQTIGIMRDKRPKSYPVAQLPVILAHALADMQVGLDANTALAAKALYQSICPTSTPDYRAQSLEWLRSIDGPLEGAEVGRLISFVESLE
ncbi:MAG: hypothetical protein AAGD07_20495 [Planctomycetota bacterium]